MSKVTLSSGISNVQTWEDLRRYSSQVIQDIVTQINGNIEFNTNIKSNLVGVTFTAANTSVSVGHGLGRTAQGYLVASRSANITIFDASTAFDDKNIYVQASGIGHAKLLVF